MISPTNPTVQHLIDAGRTSVQKPQTGATQGDDFASKLMDVLKEVNESQNKSSQLNEDLLTGRRPVEYHDVMIAMEKASASLQLTMAVRNKVLEAYQEIDRMQV